MVRVIQKGQDPTNELYIGECRCGETSMFGKIESLGLYIPSQEEIETGKELRNGDYVVKSWPEHRGNKFTEINDKLYFLGGLEFSITEDGKRYGLIEEEDTINPIKEFKKLYPQLSISLSCLVKLHLEANTLTGEFLCTTKISKSSIVDWNSDLIQRTVIYDLENDIPEELSKASEIFQRLFNVRVSGVEVSCQRPLTISEGCDVIGRPLTELSSPPQPKTFFAPSEGSIRKVVCSATYLKSGRIIVGVRHFDRFMRNTIKDLGEDTIDAEQGFVDQYGNFLTREEAWEVASRAGQIIRRVGGDEGKLYSENLY